MNFVGNLPFSFLERVFPTKALPYHSFHKRGVYRIKKEEKMSPISKILLIFGVS